MNFNNFNCIVCHFPFDDSIHLPRMLNNCSHSVCSLCLSKSILSKSKTFICPKDNKIYSNLESLDNFNINQMILNNMIEEKKNNNEDVKLSKKESKKSFKTQKTSKTKLDTFSFSDTLLSNNNLMINNNSTNINTNMSNSNILNSPRCYVKKTIKFNQNNKINISDNSLICSIHSLPLNVICVNDRQKICGQCALNDLHLNHQVLTEQKFIEYVDELVKIFQNIEKNQNNNIEVNDIKTNIILEKIDNKITRSKNKIKKICIDLIDNINFQLKQIEKFLDLRKNEIFNKFKYINYNIEGLKESANNWMEIISRKLIEANTGSIEDINLDCLKLLDTDPNKNIFNLINTGKQLSERYNFIKETREMIERLNKFSQNGLNIIPNNSIIDTIMALTTINEGNCKPKQNMLYNQNVLTTMDNRDRNNIYKNMKINFNFNNKANLETPLFKIEEDKDLIDGLCLTPIAGLHEQIKNINSPKIYDNSILSENEQCKNTISNLSNLYSGRNYNNEDTSNKMDNNRIYSKKKLDDFYSKEYVINFKNINDNKTRTQSNFYDCNNNKKDIEVYIKKINNELQSPEHKLNQSDSCPRYNTQFDNVNLENLRFKNNIIVPISPINKKDIFPKLIREKTCDVSFIPSKKRRNSSDALIINNNINTIFKSEDDNLNKVPLSPKLKSGYNIINNNMANIFSPEQEFRTVEKYQNKKDINYKSNSSNKNNKNKSRSNNRSKNKFTRCISYSSSLVTKNEVKDIPIFFNNKDNKINNKTINSPHKKIIKDDISNISTITNKINKSTSNARHINKSCVKEQSPKSININKNKNNTTNIINNNFNSTNKFLAYITKDIDELRELVNNQMIKINPCFNHINMKGEGLQFLSEFFQKNKNKKYRELKLIGCNLNDDDFSSIIKNIIDNGIEVGTLNATYNQIGDNSFKCIFEMIKKVKGLKNIFLYNNIFSKGFKDKIKNYDRENSLYNVRLFL